MDYLFCDRQRGKAIEFLGMASFITVDRKILKWEWYQDIKVFHLFLYMLLRANWEDGRWKGIDVKRGQLITGRLQLNKDTGLSEREIRTCLNKLKTTGEIAIKATSKYSIITICKYDVYQNKYDKSDQQIDQQIDQRETNKRPTNDQQTTTNNTLNKNKEESNGAIHLNGFACYDVEEYILGNQQQFEKICIATSRNADEVKKELHLYHLWLAKKEMYPMGKVAATAGIESWIHNSKTYKQKYGNTETVMTKVEKLPDGNLVAKKYG